MAHLGHGVTTHLGTTDTTHPIAGVGATAGIPSSLGHSAGAEDYGMTDGSADLVGASASVMAGTATYPVSDMITADLQCVPLHQVHLNLTARQAWAHQPLAAAAHPMLTA
jgi:hypothetical protein